MYKLLREILATLKRIEKLLQVSVSNKEQPNINTISEAVIKSIDSKHLMVSGRLNR